MNVDPITLEVIRNRLIGASRDIRRVVEWAAYSPILYEVIDFSCAMLDAEANLLAETPGLPIFLANLSYSVRCTYETIGREKLNPGDVIICNDPYNGGGTHCPDIVILCPAFYQGKIVGWAAFRGHTVDMGGIYPGGWYSNTTEVFQEGFRLPPVKIWVEGKPNEDVFRLIRTNTRVPDSVLGDIRAMIAGVRTAATRINDIIEKYGLETTLSAMDEMLQQGEKLALAALAKIPEGEYSAEVILDGDGNDDAPLSKELLLKLKITVQTDKMIVDYTGSSPQSIGPMNTPEPSTISATRYGFKIITTPLQPSNEGFFRPLEVIIPEGSILKPKFPAATAMWPTPITTIPDLMLKALAPAIPEKVRAGHFGDSMANFIYGNDPKTGKYYVCAEGDAGGYGGQYNRDGGSAMFSMSLGDTYNMPVEVAEVRFPFRVEHFEFAQDSGGPGKYRGGLGVRRDYIIINHDCGMTVTTDRVIHTPPWGIFGGKSGRPSITKVFRANGSEESWRKVSNLPLHDGDITSFQTGGGGGYGSPLDREPEEVLLDVVSGYISFQSASENYGVIINESDMSVNKELTEQRRNEMRKSSGG
jgi:N-methylhydantoinase B